MATREKQCRRHPRRPFGPAALLACAAMVLATACAGPAGPWLDGAVERLSGATPESVEPLPSVDDGRPAVGARWHSVLQRYAQDDLRDPAPGGGVVFIGSSSISHWTQLAADFPGQRVVGRGLGGARLVDCARLADRLVWPYRPRAVVVYAGDNDLAEGATPDEVFGDYLNLVERIRSALPDARILFVSIKPSPARAALLPAVRSANALIAEHARRNPGLAYVDVYTPMLDADGHPRPALFDPDGLHLNRGGYALWQKALAPHLDRG